MQPNKFPSDSGKRFAERIVYEKIRDTFPKYIDAHYSVQFINNKRNIDGECDFVLVDEKRGITYIEVKGGKEVGAIRKGQGSQFYSISNFGSKKNKSRNPYEQAYDAMYEIKNKIQDAFQEGYNSDENNINKFIERNTKFF